MIEEIKNNIEIEIEMTNQLSGFMDKFQYSGEAERKMLLGVINSLLKKIKTVNDSFPELLKTVPSGKPLPNQVNEKAKIKQKIEKVPLQNRGKDAAVRHFDRGKFLKQLNIGENLVKKIKNRRFEVKEKEVGFKKSNLYAKLSNKFFFSKSEKWIKQGKFKNLSLDLKRSNMNILTATYISMMVFTTLLSFFFGLAIGVFFLFFSIIFEAPFLVVFEGNLLIRLLKTFWIPLAVPVATWTALYFYPGAEKRSLSKKIDQELPFAVIHMGSISGSGIDPMDIFKIIGLSDEYKYVKKEIRKILNQTNLYGYDLTNSLRNVARVTPSKNLSELLTGMSITINSGGDIKTFFEKRAQSLLLSYRLEREKFTKVAETFMDIYISIVIATPMILLLLLVMISISGVGLGLGITQMTLAIIGIVAVINVLFLTFLHLKQPGY